MSLSKRPQNRKTGFPAWLVFLLAIAFVFGAYYLWLGVRNFVQTGGQGIVEATERAVVISTATAERAIQVETNRPTQRPTVTPLPECEEFVVNVPNAIVREQPNMSSAIVDSLFEGSAVCVIGREGDSEWFLIDSNIQTRRLEPAYMHETIIEAVHPTLTPTKTFTPLPTVTAAPTLSPTVSPTPRPTDTPDTSVSDTPTPTYTPSPTQPLQSA